MRLGQGHRELLGAELDYPTLRAQATKRQAVVLARADDQMRGPGNRLRDHGQGVECLKITDPVEVVQDEDKRPFTLGERIGLPGE